MVEAQIAEEIANGRYVVVKRPQHLVSALGAIPKAGTNKVRLIHDCSRPIGGSLNDLAPGEGYHYQTLQDAAKLIQCGDYLAKVDLASAYRSVRIHKDDYHLSGLHWTFEGDKEPTFLCETRLPFGARASPGHFNSLTQAVRCILADLGHKGIVAYLDDFLVVGRTHKECMDSMNCLMHTLRRLGFSINYNKVEGPQKVLTFLGVEINTDLYTLSLPEVKLAALYQEILRTTKRRSITKRELQSLVGRLSWASQVLYGGRAHLRRIIDRINSLGSPSHKTRITEHIRADLYWWINNVYHFNGCTPIAETRGDTSVCIDACDEGAGGYYSGDWYHLNWDFWPGTRDLHINYKEVLALAPAVDLWGPGWRGKTVTVHSDNQAAVGILNRGTAKNPFVMGVLRRIFWLSVRHNFRWRAVYYPGYRNIIADAASRLREPRGFVRLQNFLQNTLLS